MKPKRWPENANQARESAIDAAEHSINALIDATAALVKGDTDEAMQRFKAVMRLQNYIVRVLDRARYGEAPGPLPGDGDKPK